MYPASQTTARSFFKRFFSFLESVGGKSFVLGSAKKSCFGIALVSQCGDSILIHGDQSPESNEYLELTKFMNELKGSEQMLLPIDDAMVAMVEACTKGKAGSVIPWTGATG